MPKIFYTERDIEDLASRGVLVLELYDDVVLTDLAYEKAGKLGVRLVEDHQQVPGTPVRPYISASNLISQSSENLSASRRVSDLKKKIRAAVIEKLGDKVDLSLIDTIIDRVLKNINFSS